LVSTNKRKVLAVTNRETDNPAASGRPSTSIHRRVVKEGIASVVILAVFCTIAFALVFGARPWHETEEALEAGALSALKGLAWGIGLSVVMFYPFGLALKWAASGRRIRATLLFCALLGAIIVAASFLGALRGLLGFVSISIPVALGTLWVRRRVE
jgi:hypothetical protein